MRLGLSLGVASASVIESELAPSAIANASALYDPSDSATLFDATSGGVLPSNGAGVARCEDKSGNAKHTTQSTAGLRPTRVVAGLGGLDCLRFDGVDDVLLKTSFGSISSAGTMFAVFKDTKAASRSFLTVMGFSTAGPSINSAAATYAYGLGKPGTAGFPQGAQTIDETDQVVMIVAWSGTTATTYLNGYKVDFTLTEVLAGGGDFQVGRHNSGFSWWGGDLGEFGAYTRKITDTEATKLTNYLKRKWGVPALAGLNWTADKVVAMGDSIDGQGSTGLYTLNAEGYQTNARVLLGSKFSPVAIGSELTGATAGARLDTIVTNHLANIIASSADVVLVGGGTNDVANGATAAFIVDAKRAIADKLRKAGKNPVVLSVPAIPLTQAGNEAGAWSAIVAATNLGLQAMCATRGYLYGDTTSTVETVAGNGIGNTSYYKDTLHPNAVGAVRNGRTLAAGLATRFTFTETPLADTDYLINYTNFPTGWTNTPPANAGTTTTSTVVDSEGTWQRMELGKGTSTSIWTVTNTAANTQSVASLPVDCVCRMRVISGAVSAALRLSTTPAGTVASDAELNAGFYLPSDGTPVFRTMPKTLAGDTTKATPILLLFPSADAIIEYQLAVPRNAS